MVAFSILPLTNAPSGSDTPKSNHFCVSGSTSFYTGQNIRDRKRERRETELEGTAARNDTLNRKKIFFENPKEKKSIEITLKKEIEFIVSSIGERSKRKFEKYRRAGNRIVL